MAKKQSKNIKNSSAKKGANAKARGPGFRSVEVIFLIRRVKEIKPIHGEDWQKVARSFNEAFPRYERTWRSLSQKFSTVANQKVPTGAAEIPVPVRLAREAQAAINEAMELQQGSDVASNFSGDGSCEEKDAEDAGDDDDEEVAEDKENDQPPNEIDVDVPPAAAAPPASGDAIMIDSSDDDDSILKGYLGLQNSMYVFRIWLIPTFRARTLCNSNITCMMYPLSPKSSNLMTSFNLGNDACSPLIPHSEA